MKLNSLNKKFALASVSLLTISTLAGFGGLVNVNAKTTVVTDQVSNGEVAIYAQSAAGNAVATTNNDGTNPDTGVANNQTGGQAGNTGTTKNDGSQQSSLEGSTPSVMANVTFSATKYTGTGVPTGCCPIRHSMVQKSQRLQLLQDLLILLAWQMVITFSIK